MPNLPCIAGEISEEITPEPWKITHEATVAFNEHLRALQNTIRHFSVVSAKGLALKPDGIHFSTPSLRVLGERYFEAFEAF